MDPSPKTIEVQHYPCQWNLELTGAARPATGLIVLIVHSCVSFVRLHFCVGFCTTWTKDSNNDNIN